MSETAAAEEKLKGSVDEAGEETVFVYAVSIVETAVNWDGSFEEERDSAAEEELIVRGVLELVLIEIEVEAEKAPTGFVNGVELTGDRTVDV